MGPGLVAMLEVALISKRSKFVGWESRLKPKYMQKEQWNINTETPVIQYNGNGLHSLNSPITRQKKKKNRLVQIATNCRRHFKLNSKWKISTI